MGLETATYLSGLVATNPLSTDPKSQGAAHLRLIKSVILATFPNINAAISASDEELNFVDGVTSAIQGQLDAKASLTAPSITTPTLTGTKETKAAIAASNIDLSLGNYFTKTIAGATTLTISNVPATGTVASFVLDLTNGGSAVVTWFAGAKWPAGAAPTLTVSGRDVLVFFTHDGGTTWNGFFSGKGMA